MKRLKILATLVTALAAGLAATAVPAQAAVSSASIDDATATLNLDGADDNVTVSVSGGLLVHGQTTGGLNSGSDWDSAEEGDQTVPADGTFTVIVNGGDGNDSITVLAKNTELAAAKVIGDGGDDVVTGADTGDSLTGGDGNDRLVGEGQRRHERRSRQRHAGLEQRRRLGLNEGDAGNDAAEVNGAQTLGDVFTLDPNAGGSSSSARTWCRSRSTPRPSASRSTASVATTRSRRMTAWARSRC